MVKSLKQVSIGIFSLTLALSFGKIVIAHANAAALCIQSGSISGQVYNDANLNGQQDASENGLAGWNVYIDSNQNMSYESGEPSVITDSTGNFSFSNLQPGTYNVREVQQQGYIETQPVYAQQFTNVVVLACGQTVGGIMIGNHFIQQGDIPSGLNPNTTSSGSGSGSGSGNNSGATSGTSTGTGTTGGSSTGSGGSTGNNGGSSTSGGSTSGGSTTGGGSTQPVGQVLGANTGDPGNGGLGGGSPAGQVLGASTTLPRTGVPAWAILGLASLFAAALSTILYRFYRPINSK